MEIMYQSKNTKYFYTNIFISKNGIKFEFIIDYLRLEPYYVVLNILQSMVILQGKLYPFNSTQR